MAGKSSSKWSAEEQNMLLMLKEEQESNGELNWEKIAIELNSKISSSKSSKQCRERYINYLKFGGREGLNLSWSSEDADKLISLYIDHGSSWIVISQHFSNKSENSIKNKFNNSIRKVANLLHDLETAVSLVPKRRSITGELLISMMDLANQLQKKIIGTGQVLNEESKIFRFRKMILDLCFKSEIFGREYLLEVIRLMKMINLRLRCFGVFKVKNRKQWKISDKGIESIFEFDKIILTQKSEWERIYLPSPQNEFITPSELPQSFQNLIDEMDGLESLNLEHNNNTYTPKRTLQEEVKGVLGEADLPEFHDDYIF